MYDRVPLLPSLGYSSLFIVVVLQTDQAFIRLFIKAIENYKDMLSLALP